nr:TolC family protein [Bacteroidota bacterium]
MRAFIIVFILQVAIMRPALAQGPLQLDLAQARELAAKQSYQVQVGQLEADKARKQISEVLAAGLPQINGSVSLQNYLDVPTQVVPNFFGSEPEVLEIQFGVPWSASAGV